MTAWCDRPKVGWQRSGACQRKIRCIQRALNAVVENCATLAPAVATLA